VGTRVRVVLNGRRVGGWVVAEAVVPPADVALQPLATVSGFGPPPEVVSLADWAAWRWAGPVSALLTTASPERVVRALPARPRAAAPTPSAADAGHVGSGTEDVVAGALGRTERPTLVTMGPAADPLALVESVLRGVLVEREASGSVVVLVPSLGWAGRLVERLGRRGWAVTDQWAAARGGWPVVVGARAGAWAPVPDLAAAVVLDAHDEAYREERAPTFNAWEVLAERARRAGAPCLLVSPCPTAVQIERCSVAEVDRAAERGAWPALTIVDRRAADPRTGLFSEELVRLAERVGPQPEPLVCVLNRTGRARLLRCAGCGELARCEHCGSPLELAHDRLGCRRCGAERPVVCAACGATRLKTLRPGVTRVREELEALLGRAVAEVAGPAARGAPSPIDEQARVLVGTEAVLHRVRHAAAVVFLDFDQHLLAPRFAAGEEALALLARAGRLVGGRARAHRSAQVMVQTRIPGHEVLAAAVHGDPARFSASERALRAELDLPPYSALALVSGAAAAEYGAGLGALAAPGVVISDLGDGRWLVRAPEHDTLGNALAAVARPKGRLRVEVDPTAV
jgi:primosomal protein N' (replication factor Y)